MRLRILTVGYPVCALSVFLVRVLTAQEAAAGFDLRATVSIAASASGRLTDAPREGSEGNAGFRAVLYPTWKLGEHWDLSGAVQAMSRPYFYEAFNTQGRGLKGDLLQGSLGYSRISSKGSFSLRAGQLSTAFGTFPLHYDSAENWLFDSPLQYGYYYAAVSTLSNAAAQVDVTRGAFDARVQLANSSTVNPRSLLQSDQYANWVWGGGYTIRQGFRVGTSFSHGPYLDRHYRYFFRGEANPSKLSAQAAGIDVQWGWGHWNVQGEWQRFVFPYRAVPTFREQAGYMEARRVLHPRWYLATRTGYLSNNSGQITSSFEAVAAYRPGAHQLVKMGYELRHADTGTHRYENTVTVELVAVVHPLSVAH